jgi:hypothetical protein
VNFHAARGAAPVVEGVRDRAAPPLNIEKGNYDIYSFKDSASTSVSFAYADDNLKNATIMNLVSQLKIYEKLVNHEMVEQTSTPNNVFTMQDISAKLRPAPEDAS